MTEWNCDECMDAFPFTVAGSPPVWCACMLAECLLVLVHVYCTHHGCLLYCIASFSRYVLVTCIVSISMVCYVTRVVAHAQWSGCLALWKLIGELFIVTGVLDEPHGWCTCLITLHLPFPLSHSLPQTHAHTHTNMARMASSETL